MILPQALRIAIAPTVGFSVQVIKGTALASIIGFVELTKAGTMLNNATFRPFLVYSLVALIYFCPVLPAVVVRKKAREASQCRSLASRTSARVSAPRSKSSRASRSRSPRGDVGRHHRQAPARARARCSAASTAWRRTIEACDRGRRHRRRQARNNLRDLRRNVGMVFQQFNLFPHLTAAENVMLAPTRREQGERRGDAALIAEEMLAKVGLSEKARQLSARSCPAASSSAWRLPGRWRCGRTCCCATRSPRRSIPNWSTRCCAWSSNSRSEGMTLILVTARNALRARRRHQARVHAPWARCTKKAAHEGAVRRAPKTPELRAVHQLDTLAYAIRPSYRRPTVEQQFVQACPTVALS